MVWFRKLLILHRNCKGFLLSPVHKHLNDIHFLKNFLPKRAKKSKKMFKKGKIFWKFGQKCAKFEHILKKGRWLHAIIACNKLQKVLKQLRSGPSSQSCLYFQDFQGSKFLSNCLLIWPIKQILRVFQWYFGIPHWHTVYG